MWCLQPMLTHKEGGDVTISYRALAALVFMASCIAILVYSARPGAYQTTQVGVPTANASANTVTVEEVYRDARVSVYRLVDRDNGVVCYWVPEGDMSCRIMATRYR